MKVLIAFLILSVIFGSIERLFPLKKQTFFRPEWQTDVVHFFMNHFLVNAGTFILSVVLYVLFHRAIDQDLQTAVRSQPALLQFGEAFLIAQLTFYGLHRLAHTHPWLWKVHAIHHSSSQLDWLASARIHPLELIITNVGVGFPLALLGFTKETFGSYLIFATFLAIFNHANTHLRFPGLRWLIATPEFHHWHHCDELAGRNKNFSGFPLIDLVFGTFYLPSPQMPKVYGVTDPIPHGYWRHLGYPFRDPS